MAAETALQYSQMVSDSTLSFSVASRSSCSWIFWNFQRFTQEKQCVESSFVNVAKRHTDNSVKQLQCHFFAKIVGKSHQKNFHLRCLTEF